MRNKTHKRLVESPMLDSIIVLRAWATLCVVIFHAGIEPLRGGAALLLLLAGYSHSKFRLKKQLNGSIFYFLPDFVLKVLIPFWLVIVGYNSLKGNHIDVTSLLLIGNNVGGTEQHSPFGIWFIQALLQSLLLFSLPLLIPKIRFWAAKNPNFYVYNLLFIACMLRVLDGSFGWGHQAQLNGEQLSYAFWLFALGAAIARIRTSLGKNLMTVLLLILPIVFYSDDWPRILSVIVGGGIALWIDKIMVPKFFIPVVQRIRNSSLFIYMLHPRAPIDSFTASWHIDLLRISIGIIIGIIGQFIYTHILEFAKKLYSNVRHTKKRKNRDAW